ncbi:hypothetical protein ACFYYS_27605 [Streptomyces sp. NPDC002120]|uniref:hypothetical protein n=1 Tax=Streptomyces sp. NPDC002120 TaxID=3364631 RepID=UPI003678109B
MQPDAEEARRHGLLWVVDMGILSHPDARRRIPRTRWSAGWPICWAAPARAGAWRERTTRYRPEAAQRKRLHRQVVSARPRGLGTSAADLARLLRLDPGGRVDTGVHPDGPRS